MYDFGCRLISIFFPPPIVLDQVTHKKLSVSNCIWELRGPFANDASRTFNPSPIDVSQVNLPKYMLESVSDRLAENIHENWSKAKIDNGWKWAKVSHTK